MYSSKLRSTIQKTNLRGINMISDEDVRQLFQNILDTPGGYNDPTIEGKIVQIWGGTPWHLWKDAHPGGCYRHMMVFGKYGVIPKYCFDCYKIEILPRTVVEFFKLLMVFEKLILPNGNTWKCMVERRPDCSGTYKALVYCRAIDEGKEVRKIIRDAVSDDISPNISVTLKRGCSEYARANPRYAQIKPGVAMMKYNKDWQTQEDLFDKNFVFQTEIHDVNTTDSYPPWDIYSMQYWLRYAATIGDMSYLTISGMTLAPLSQLKRPPFSAPHTNKK
jgi:hypothetical protein